MPPKITLCVMASSVNDGKTCNVITKMKACSNNIATILRSIFLLGMSFESIGPTSLLLFSSFVQTVES